MNLTKLKYADLCRLWGKVNALCQKRMYDYDRSSTHTAGLFDQSWDWHTFAIYWPALYRVRRRVLAEGKRRENVAVSRLVVAATGE